MKAIMTTECRKPSKTRRAGDMDWAMKIAGGLLLVLGILKVYSWAGGELPATNDAVLPIPIRQLALWLGLVEVGSGASMLALLRPLRAAQYCTAMGSCFVVYRWLYSFMGSGQPCPCLGVAKSWLPFLAFYEQNLLTSIAVWFLLIGLWSWVKEALNA
jgi:hypothetical protein